MLQSQYPFKCNRRSVCRSSPITKLAMASMKLLLVLALVPLVLPQYVYEEPLLYDTFPEDFLWGVATSAYQVKFFLN